MSALPAVERQLEWAFSDLLAPSSASLPSLSTLRSPAGFLAFFFSYPLDCPTPASEHRVPACLDPLTRNEQRQTFIVIGGG